MFVAPDDPVKILRADADEHVVRRARRLSVFGYVEWVLGPPRAGERRFVVTEQDEATGIDPGAQRLQRGVQQAVSLWHATETARSFTVRPGGVRRAQPDAAGAGGALPRRARRAGRRGARPVRRAATVGHARAGRVAQRRVRARTGTRPRPCARAGARVMRRSSRRTPCSPPPSTNGTRRSARSRSARQTTRSI